MSGIIEISYGALEGIERNGCALYLGIPFAKAPVGDLAFRHPLPPEPWSGVLKADHGSCNPIQAPGGFYTGNNSMDCLYLNVFVPEEVPAPLPVMVWIYGGSYSQGGAGAEDRAGTRLQYDLSRFARETGCVVVTFNYRLNLYNHVPSDSPMGCFHASELPVLFGLNMLGIDGTGDKTGKTMHGIWARFAKEGDPGWDAGTTQEIT